MIGEACQCPCHRDGGNCFECCDGGPELDQLTAERDALKAEVARLELAQKVHIGNLHEADEWRDEITAERDAAVRELNAIRGEHTPGEAYTLANPRPSLAGLVAENLAGCRAENEQLRAKLDIATKELLYINNCSGTQIQDACHACRTDNDRLRAELDVERMRLAGCGVAAHGAGDEHFANMLPEYDSDALRTTRALRTMYRSSVVNLTELREAANLRLQCACGDTDCPRCKQVVVLLAKLKAAAASEHETIREALLRSENERLRAERSTDVVHVGRLVTQLAELRAESIEALHDYNDSSGDLRAELAELREAGERMLRVFNEFADMVTPTPETAVFAPPLGEATENFRAVLAKTALALT